MRRKNAPKKRHSIVRKFFVLLIWIIIVVALASVGYLHYRNYINPETQQLLTIPGPGSTREGGYEYGSWIDDKYRWGVEDILNIDSDKL